MEDLLNKEATGAVVHSRNCEYESLPNDRPRPALAFFHVLCHSLFLQVIPDDNESTRQRDSFLFCPSSLALPSS
jgi:hypothetical protein